MAQDKASAAEEELQLVSFTLGEEEYGVDILQVNEIIRYMDNTKIPNSPMFVEGIINLRGKVIPIIDIRKRFNLPDLPHDNATRIIVVNINGKTVGIIVDSVSEVLRVPRNIIDPAPEVACGIDHEYIKGVGKLQDRLLIIIDLNRILSEEEVGHLHAM